MADFWPMGCKKLKNRDKEEALMKNSNYIAQEKFDGISAIVQVEKGKLKFTTRGASVDNPDVPINITHRMTDWLNFDIGGAYFDGLVLDAEITHPELTASELAGKLNYKSDKEVPSGIEVNIYDILRFNSNKGLCNIESNSLITRLQVLGRFGALNNIHGFKIAPHTVGYDAKQKLLEDIWEEGKEGIVLKNLSSRYNQGLKRANTWYKIKKSDTLDAIITGSLVPSKYYKDPDTRVVDMSRITKSWGEGWIGSITYTYTVDDETYHGSTSGLTDNLKMKLSNGYHNIKSEFIGRTIELEYQNKTVHGNLRHPRFIRFRDEVEK